MSKTLSKIIFSAAFLTFIVSGAVLFANATTSAVDTPIDVAVTLDPIISITTDATDNTLNIPITPTATGTLGTTDLTVSIHTNNPTGYTLTMSSSTNDTSLTHTTDSTHTIPTTTATQSTPAILPTNTWGYGKWTTGQSTTPTTFSNIPALSAPENITITTDLTEDPDTKLTFAANASSTLASGTYTNTIVFTATTNYVPGANPPEPNPANPTTYGAMQTMTNAECSTTRGTAFDARNSQTYYVQKIGNLCWMETNLRYAGYDGSTEQWYDTWGYADDRYATTTALAANTLNANDNTRPLTTTASGYLGGSSTTQYTYAGYFDTNGSTDYTNTTASGGFYGHLYNWCAAMGGQASACNDTSTTGFDTTQSICPSGWRLPTGNTAGDFGAMTTAINAQQNNAAGSTNLRAQFLAVYSGYFASSLANQNSYGSYWSSTAVGVSSVYILHVGVNNVYPGTGTSDKYLGQALRCVL